MTSTARIAYNEGLPDADATVVLVPATENIEHRGIRWYVLKLRADQDGTIVGYYRNAANAWVEFSSDEHTGDEGVATYEVFLEPLSTVRFDFVNGSAAQTIFEVNQAFSELGQDRAAGDITVGDGITVDTELPSASALADAAANPNTPKVGAALLGFNGTTWDRLRSSIAGGLLVTIGTAAEALLTAIAVSLSVMDDWDESDRAKVNPIVGQAGVQGASGAVSATTQRVVLATDVGLPAGSAAIGTVTGVGPAAHGAAVSGNPLLTGLDARSTNPTPVDTGDVVRALSSLTGQQIVLIGALPGTEVNGKSNMTDTSADDIIAAIGAGTRIVVMGFSVMNRHASQDATVEIRDGTTARQSIFCKAGGFGAVESSVTPLFVAADNAAVTAISDANANILVNVWGYTRPA